MVSPQTLFLATKSRSEHGGFGVVPRSTAVRNFISLCGGVSEVAGMLGVKAAQVDDSIKKNDGVFVIDSGEATDFSKELSKDDAAGTGGTETLPFVARYNTIMTTSERDREGDVLKSAGAKIDDSMPVLWQHMPYMPIGRFIRTLRQDEKLIEIRNGLANVSMIDDVLRLMEVKALRTSHGFRPIKYDELRDAQGNYLGGYEFEEFSVLESSLVSVPANAGAIITQYQNEKLTHPLVKALGRGLFENRNPIVRSGWDATQSLNSNPAGGVNVTVNLNTPAAPAAAAPIATETPTDAKGTTAQVATPTGEPAAQGQSAGVPTAGAKDAKGAVTPAAPITPTTPAKAGKKEGSTDEPGDAGDGSGTETVTNQDEGTGKPANGLETISNALKALAGTAELPAEASGRLTLAASMLDECGAKMAEACDMVVSAAQSRDIVGMMGAYSLCMSSCAALPGIVEELGRAAAVEGLADDVAAGIVEAGQGISDMIAMMNESAGYEEEEEQPAGTSTTETPASPSGSEDDEKALAEFNQLLSV